MQSLTLLSPRELAWEDVPEPELSNTGALVRPLAVSACDFDHLLTSGRIRLPLPVAIGHECVGEVLLVGDEVNNVKPGDRVIVCFQINCGTCHNCLKGQTSSCQAVPWLSAYGLGKAGGSRGGAMSDKIMVPYADTMLIPYPPELPLSQAPCLSCNIADAYRCVVPQLENRPGAPVLICGGDFNNIAIYAGLMATICGASQVDLYGLPKSDEIKAKRLGLSVYSQPQDVPLNHYPIVVDASRQVEHLHLAIAAAAPAGELTSIAMYVENNTPMPLMSMFEKCLTFKIGQPHIQGVIKAALALVVKHRDDFAAVIDAVVPWEQAPAVFVKGGGKTVFVRD